MQCSIPRLLSYHVVLPLSRRMNAPHSLLKFVVVGQFQNAILNGEGGGGLAETFQEFHDAVEKG